MYQIINLERSKKKNIFIKKNIYYRTEKKNYNETIYSYIRDIEKKILFKTPFINIESFSSRNDFQKINLNSINLNLNLVKSQKKKFINFYKNLKYYEDKLSSYVFNDFLKNNNSEYKYLNNKLSVINNIFEHYKINNDIYNIIFEYEPIIKKIKFIKEKSIELKAKINLRDIQKISHLKKINKKYVESEIEIDSLDEILLYFETIKFKTIFLKKNSTNIRFLFELKQIVRNKIIFSEIKIVAIQIIDKKNKNIY